MSCFDAIPFSLPGVRWLACRHGPFVPVVPELLPTYNHRQLFGCMHACMQKIACPARHAWRPHDDSAPLSVPRCSHVPRCSYVPTPSCAVSACSVSAYDHTPHPTRRCLRSGSACSAPACSGNRSAPRVSDRGCADESDPHVGLQAERGRRGGAARGGSSSQLRARAHAMAVMTGASHTLMLRDAPQTARRLALSVVLAAPKFFEVCSTSQTSPAAARHRCRRRLTLLCLRIKSGADGSDESRRVPPCSTAAPAKTTARTRRQSVIASANHGPMCCVCDATPDVGPALHYSHALKSGA